MPKPRDNSTTIAPELRMPIGQMFVTRGLITEAQLDQALEHQAQIAARRLDPERECTGLAPPGP